MVRRIILAVKGVVRMYYLILFYDIENHMINKVIQHLKITEILLD